MSLEGILAALERDAGLEVARIEAAGAAEAVAALERARAEAAAIEAAAAGAPTPSEAAAEARRTLASARLAAAAARRAAEEALVARVLEDARAAIRTAREGPGYAGALRAIATEALALLPDAETVAVDPRDVPLLAGSSVGGKARVVAGPAGAGGAVVATADGRCVRSTLEERLARAGAHARRIVAEELDRALADAAVAPGAAGERPEGHT